MSAGYGAAVPRHRWRAAHLSQADADDSYDLSRIMPSSSGWGGRRPGRKQVLGGIEPGAMPFQPVSESGASTLAGCFSVSNAGFSLRPAHDGSILARSQVWHGIRDGDDRAAT